MFDGALDIQYWKSGNGKKSDQSSNINYFASKYTILDKLEKLGAL